MSEKFSRKEKATLACLYMTGWLITYGGIFGAWENNSGFFRIHTCRENMSFSLLISAIPPTWILAPFMTGFYEDGFKFYCEKRQ